MAFALQKEITTMHYFKIRIWIHEGYPLPYDISPSWRKINYFIKIRKLINIHRLLSNKILNIR